MSKESSKPRGVIAAGHKKTVQAGEEILRAGGNAYDAAIACAAAACVVEPVLASAGGGGFAVVKPTGKRAQVYDFFVQTPHIYKPTSETDFKAIIADFGSTMQEFHIGKASAAVPGQVKGMFALHEEHGSMPMSEIFEPAVKFAREGVQVNSFQAYLFTVLESIYATDAQLKKTFESLKCPGSLALEGDLVKQPEQADFWEVLGLEGQDLFYCGEIAAQIHKDMEEGGGLITRRALEDYEVIKRKALSVKYRGATIEMNPPPATGGLMIGLALKLFEAQEIESTDPYCEDYLLKLAGVLDKTLQARVEMEAKGMLDERMLDQGFVKKYADMVLDRPKAYKGTTHISVIDKNHNMVAMTLSNGQGQHYVVSGTGVILNNMMGEDDLMQGGFDAWAPNTRMTSMMTPGTVFWECGKGIAFGSGGCARIRTAILQFLLNIVDFKMDLQGAVNASRLHMEEDKLYIEGGFDGDLKHLTARYPIFDRFDEKNLFFGGAHTAGFSGGAFQAAADPRRKGASVIL